MRNKGMITSLFVLFLMTSVSAQEIQMSEIASLEQVYGEAQESQALLPMNDVGMEWGYILYETDIIIEAEQSDLEVENVRDYVAVYVDGKLQGRMTDEQKKLPLKSSAGKHRLQLYAENIGRITYGPEVLDNSKGLFGAIHINGISLENWIITPLLVKECATSELKFKVQPTAGTPCFYRGVFDIETPHNTNLDMTGWGMGEVWVNGEYVGAYWEESSLRSIQIPASSLLKGKNSVVVFDMKNNGTQKVRLSDKAIFN